MAYDVTKEKQEVLAQIEKNSRGDVIQVSKITMVGRTTESVDIRIMYTDDDGELRPTRKGVRFNSEQAAEVAAALVKNFISEDGLEDFIESLNEDESDSDEGEAE